MAEALSVGDQDFDKRKSDEMTNDFSDLTSGDRTQLSGVDDHCPVQSQTRKRRRGVIEKRRRDRINSSLAELRRLVPSAFEKQGSQKLEKAEILQLAVQHLRYLGSKGSNINWRDTDCFSAEYHSMGFRFCASEVDEILSNEGVELHHPLRLRLSNHLQCFGAQRQNAIDNSHQQSNVPRMALIPFASTLSLANFQCANANSVTTTAK